MSVQGISPLNGIVANPYGQAQAAAVNPIGIDPNAVANNTILTGSAPLASAVAPAQQQAQQIATSQAMTTPITAPAPAKQGIQLAENPPAPEGCGNNVDCKA